MFISVGCYCYIIWIDSSPILRWNLREIETELVPAIYSFILSFFIASVIELLLDFKVHRFIKGS